MKNLHSLSFLLYFSMFIYTFFELKKKIQKKKNSKIIKYQLFTLFYSLSFLIESAQTMQSVLINPLANLSSFSIILSAQIKHLISNLAKKNSSKTIAELHAVRQASSHLHAHQKMSFNYVVRISMLHHCILLFTIFFV